MKPQALEETNFFQTESNRASPESPESMNPYLTRIWQATEETKIKKRDPFEALFDHNEGHVAMGNRKRQAKTEPLAQNKPS